MFVRLLIRLEGLAVVTVSLYFYGKQDISWLYFFILLFAPDLSLLGYLLNKKAGMVSYNLLHTYIFPLIGIVIAIFITNSYLLAFGLIWCAHIGMDRLLGFGLKYSKSFRETHIQKL